MPLTRAQKANQGAENDVVIAESSEQKKKGGRKKGKIVGRRGGNKGTKEIENIESQVQSPMLEDEDIENQSFVDDPGQDEKLQAKNGHLGVEGSNGWEQKTNFIVEVHALINSSSSYKLKGYIFKLTFTSGCVKHIYVPENDFFSSDKFKRHFDKQEIHQRMLLLASSRAWHDLLRKLVHTYTNTVFKQMSFVENIGLQVLAVNCTNM